MGSSRPLVSVITPAYNCGALLAETAASVRRQTFADFEHVIVDDCSTDGTRDALAQMAAEDGRVRPLLLPHNQGPVKARNAGIAQARGRYLAFLDADDLWLPDKLEKQVALMEASHCPLSFTDYRHMSADGSKVGSIVCGPDAITLGVHYRTRFFCCSSVMVDHELVPGFAFPDIAPAIRAEDFLGWARIIKTRGAAQRCPHDVVRYRLVPGSRSAAKIRAARSVWHLYRDLEGLPLLAAAYYFVRFAMAATFKHLRARPRLERRQVDALP